MKITEKVRWLATSDTLEARRTRQILKIILVLGLFIGLFWIIPLSDVLDVLRTVDPLLVSIGFILGFIGFFLNSVVLYLLARQQGIGLGVMQIFGINLVVKFYMLFMPLIVGGTSIRWYKLSRPGGKSTEALVVIAFNRLVDIFLAVVLGLVFWFLSGQYSAGLSAWWLVGLILLITLFWFALTRMSKTLFRRIKSLAEGTTRRILSVFLRRLAKLMEAVANYANFPALDLFLMIFVGVVRNLVGVASFAFLAKSIGIGLPVIDLGWIRSVIVIAASLPISIAGGLGLREVSLVAMFSLFDISANVALAFSLLLIARDFFTSIPGGIFEAVGAFRSPKVT